MRIGAPEVSLLDILEGRTKYNNRPVRAEQPQGTAFEYSDAGVLRFAADDLGYYGQRILRLPWETDI